MNERDSSEDIRVDERILLKWFLKSFFFKDGKVWTELVCSRIEKS